ncbi:MAG: hypothetical protein GX802_08010, partial [Clostridiales bacterium]|nr:hypothetical protein [Clostridiales bacterium]
MKQSFEELWYGTTNIDNTPKTNNPIKASTIGGGGVASTGGFGRNTYSDINQDLYNQYNVYQEIVAQKSYLEKLRTEYSNIVQKSQFSQRPQTYDELIEKTEFAKQYLPEVEKRLNEINGKIDEEIKKMESLREDVNKWEDSDKKTQMLANINEVLFTLRNPTVWEWLGNNFMAGINSFNKSVFETLDFLLPDEVFGEGNALDKTK